MNHPMDRCDRPRFTGGDVVQHFKREMMEQSSIIKNPNLYLYEIVGDGYETEHNQHVMVYRAMYGEKTLYVRPYDMFMSEVDREKYPEIKQKYRFEKNEGGYEGAKLPHHEKKNEFNDTDGKEYKK